MQRKELRSCPGVVNIFNILLGGVTLLERLYDHVAICECPPKDIDGGPW